LPLSGEKRIWPQIFADFKDLKTGEKNAKVFLHY